MINYKKIIKKALKLSTHKRGDLTFPGSTIYFICDIDWEALCTGGTAVGTDVFIKLGKKNIFAFSLYAALSEPAGCVPESIKDLETGMWTIYTHKKFITPNDVALACKKWLKLQCPIEGTSVCNIYLDDEGIGCTWLYESYPNEMPAFHEEDRYIDSFYRKDK